MEAAKTIKTITARRNRTTRITNLPPEIEVVCECLKRTDKRGRVTLEWRWRFVDAYGVEIQHIKPTIDKNPPNVKDNP